MYKRPAHRDAWTAYLKDLNSGAMSERPEVIISRLQNLTSGWRHAGDGPINFLVAESLAAYPKAKFILTVRDGPDGGEKSWYESFDAAMGVQFRDGWSRVVYRSLISSVEFLRMMDDSAMVYKKKMEKDVGLALAPEWYSKHNARVERLIPKEQLLKFNVKEGWDPLCEFLGTDVPDEDFPRVNELESMKWIYLMKQVFGLCTWVLYISLVVGMVVVAMRPGMVAAAINGGLGKLYPLLSW